MKEVLFKAKRTDNGEWVEGFVARPFKSDSNGKVLTYCFNAIDEQGWYEEVIVSAETICPYTGLTDRNGKKIWKNDIVRESEECDELGKKLYFYYQIIWDKEYCAFAGCNIRTKEIAKFSDLGEVEVVMNAFDNPELLDEIN